MARESLRDEQYWARIVERRSASAQRNIVDVDAGTLPSHQRLTCARAAAEDLLELISCRYSAGLSGFREPLVDAARMINLGWDGSYLPTDKRKGVLGEYAQIRYDQILWCLSLGHLLGAEDDFFRTLAAVLDRDRVCDLIFEFLLRSRLQDRPVVLSDNYQVYFIPKLYRQLREAVTEPDLSLATEALVGYIRQDWYRIHSGAGWYNIHKSDEDIYTGYWCWEAAAVVKLRGLDDSGFRDWKYYPKDMLAGLN